MPSPLPPSTPQRLAGARAVMFGQTWTDPNGDERTADHDGILLELLQGSNVVATLFTTPETGMHLALELQRAAVAAIGNTIDDDGNRPSLPARLARINAAYKAAGE